MQLFKFYLAGVFSVLSLTTILGQIQDDPILKVIKSEVDRNKDGLHAGNLDYPFWISYRFLKASRTTVVASEGYLLSKETRQNNSGAASLLMGDYTFNNNNYQSYNPASRSTIGETNIESALKYAIWSQLDPAYKRTAEIFERKKVQIAQQNIPEEELKIHDWDQSTPVQYYQKREFQGVNLDFLSDYCRKASLALCKDRLIIASEFRAETIQGDYYYYSTDGFMYRLPVSFIELSASVECLSGDGQKMAEEYCYYFDETKDIIPIEALCAEIIKYNELLIEESKAPLLSDSYSGPVLYEGTAVSEAVRQCFINKNNGLLAKRKEISQSSTYESSGNSENQMEQMMNKKVADRRLDFISMTGTTRWNGEKLIGYTPIDAQGVKPDSSLILIEKGVLRNLLSDRKPTKTNPKSNGHSLFNIDSPDANLGAGVLRLKASQTIPEKVLKDSLLAAAKEEGYDFAYLYKGYTHMSGCFLYKVYQDGREEMVRNGSINDLNQKQFKYILHIGAEESIQNTMTEENRISLIVPCGIIFEELEIVRNNNVTLTKPYIVPRPEIKSEK